MFEEHRVSFDVREKGRQDAPCPTVAHRLCGVSLASMLSGALFGAAMAQVQVRVQVVLMQVLVTSGCNPAQRDPDPPVFAQAQQCRRGTDLLADEERAAAGGKAVSVRLLPPPLRPGCRPQLATMGLRVREAGKRHHLRALESKTDPFPMLGSAALPCGRSRNFKLPQNNHQNEDCPNCVLSACSLSWRTGASAVCKATSGAASRSTFDD